MRTAGSLSWEHHHHLSHQAESFEVCVSAELTCPAQVSDRPLHKMVENAEGKGRFMLLNYPLLLKDGLIRLKEEIDNKRFKTHEEYIHFFEQVKNNKIQEYKLELR